MSRFVPQKPYADQVLAERGLEALLLFAGRVNVLENEIWTAHNFVSLTEHFVNNLDEGKVVLTRSFKGSWTSFVTIHKAVDVRNTVAIKPVSVKCRCGIKRNSVSKVWNFSAEPMSTGSQYLSDEVLSGIGSAGTAYFTHRWREIRFLVNAMRNAKALGETERGELASSSWAFSEWLEAIPEEGDRQLELILPFLLFPDSFERISSSADIQHILTAIAGLDRADVRAMSKTDRARAIFDLRRLKEAEVGAPVDFYFSPLRQLWKPTESAPGPDDRVETKDLPKLPLNQILYGPPGTGKTFRTVERAVEILDPQLVLGDLSRQQIKDRFDQFREAGFDKVHHFPPKL